MLFRMLVFLLELVSLTYAHLNISSLNCFNDYEETMVCEFTSNTPFNCSAYSLDLVSQHQDHFMCTFMDSSRNSKPLSRCGCTIKMLLMANTESYTRYLLEGGRVIHTKVITALDNIKPRAPEILSVDLMENGNYNIKCKNHYDNSSFLYDQLETQLSYRKKGEADAAWRTISATLPSQEIPGRDLEPSSTYIVKARSHSPHYNTQFSDWSPEVEWTVPASIQSVWKMVVPALSVLLIIVICASYRCWTRLKIQWWDRIPTPRNEIKYMLPGNAKVFTPKLYDPWSIHPDALTIAHNVEKSWVRPGRPGCDRDFSYKNVSGCQPAIDSGVGLRQDSRTELSGSVGSCCSSQSGYRNILCPRSPGPDSLGSTGCGSPFSATLPTAGSDSCPVCTEPGLLETPGPLAHLHRDLLAPDLLRELSVMPTDFEYRPLDGGSAGPPPAEGADPSCSEVDILDTSLQSSRALTCVRPCRADDGYESFGEAIARAAQSQGRFPACTLAPCEEGYQVLQTTVEYVEQSHLAPSEADVQASSVDGPENCTGQVQSSKGGIPHSVISQFLPRTDTESPSRSALNAPPAVQMFVDCSYQRV